jgi:hypothetical protein
MGSNTLDKAKSPALAALLSSAVLLPAYQSAQADAPPESSEIGFRYGKYQEDAVAGGDTLSGEKSGRYDIDVAQFNLIVPVGDSWSVGQRWTLLIGQKLDATKWFLHDEHYAQERNHEKTKTKSFTGVQGQGGAGCHHW